MISFVENLNGGNPYIHHGNCPRGSVRHRNALLVLSPSKFALKYRYNDLDKISCVFRDRKIIKII
jgi:hypothetical protein